METPQLQNVIYFFILTEYQQSFLHICRLWQSHWSVLSPLSSMRLTSCGCSTSRWGTWSTPMAQMPPTSRANWVCQWSCATQSQTRGANTPLLLHHPRWKESQSPSILRRLHLLFLSLQPFPRLMCFSCATTRTPSASRTSSTCPLALFRCSATLGTTPTVPRRKPRRPRWWFLSNLIIRSCLRLPRFWSRSLLLRPPSASSRVWSTTAIPTGTPTAWLTTLQELSKGRSWAPRPHLLHPRRKKRKL